MTRARKLALRSLLLAAGGCCLALVSLLPAYAVPLTVGGMLLPALAGLVGVGEMNEPPDGR